MSYIQYNDNNRISSIYHSVPINQSYAGIKNGSILEFPQGVNPELLNWKTSQLIIPKEGQLQINDNNEIKETIVSPPINEDIIVKENKNESVFVTPPQIIEDEDSSFGRFHCQINFNEISDKQIKENNKRRRRSRMKTSEISTNQNDKIPIENVNYNPSYISMEPQKEQIGITRISSN